MIQRVSVEVMKRLEGASSSNRKPPKLILKQFLSEGKNYVARTSKTDSSEWEQLKPAKTPDQVVVLGLIPE